MPVNRCRQYGVTKLHKDRQINITYVLVRDNFDILYVAGGFKDLAQDILGHTRIQTTHVESSLIRLGRSTSREGTGAGGGHDIVAAHGGGNGGRDRVVVGRDMQRRRRHMGVGTVLAILVAWGACVRLGGRRKLASGGTSVGHFGG